MIDPASRDHQQLEDTLYICRIRNLAESVSNLFDNLKFSLQPFHGVRTDPNHELTGFDDVSAMIIIKTQIFIVQDEFDHFHFAWVKRDPQAV